ncbi:MAG TPA: chloride channel protein [Candidatus Binataceae bacterium]|nr:chloride channel protein [Candidatus Binataceae bacterium]
MRSPGFGLRNDQLEYVQLIMLSVAVGVLGALGNFGFRALISFFTAVFQGLEWTALGIEKGGYHWLLIPIILMSGGVLILLLDRVFPEDVLGYGFPQFLEQINLGNPRIKRRWMFVKAMGAALSLGCGASVGREGPIAQIGGAIGSAVARLRNLSPDRVKVLVAAGAGAGIATTFNAPIGGLMFAQEIVLLGHAELANLTLLIIATTSAVVTSRAIHGSENTFLVPQFQLRSYIEMITYGVMGVGMGILGAGFIRFFHFTAGMFRKMNVPSWIKLELGLALVGVIATVWPQNLSDGYPVINRAMAGEFGLAMLAGLTLAKFVGSSISLGCGTPGGVFGPVFFIGTMAGGTFQRLFAMALPGLTGPRGSYSLVGLGAFLAATTHAPLTALFLLFEMTGGYEIALPAMIATVTALVVARAIESESIDTYRLAREGKTLEIGQERLALSQIPVSAVMTKDVALVSENTALADLLRMAGETPQSTLPVVSSEGDLSGIVVTRQLLGLLAGGGELGPLVNAYDLAEGNCAEILPTENLYAASQLMEHEGLDELPVVERRYGGKFLGLITRQHIVQALNRVTASITSLATRDQPIFWATGYRVVRVEVPESAAGRTIRELDPRARFSVTLLAARSAGDPESGFTPVTPDQELHAGDMVIVAGRPGDVRKFERDLDQPGNSSRNDTQSAASSEKT